jgi:hypothetical protein
MQHVTAKQIHEALNAAVKAKHPLAYVQFSVCLCDARCVGAGDDFTVRVGNCDVPVEKVGGKYWAFTVFFDETFSFRPYGSIQIPPRSAMQLTETGLVRLCKNLLQQVDGGVKRFPV